MARLDLATSKPQREARKRRRRRTNWKIQTIEPKGQLIKHPVADHVNSCVESSLSVNDLPSHLEEHNTGMEDVNKGDSNVFKSSDDEELPSCVESTYPETANDGDYVGVQPISDTSKLIEDEGMNTRSDVDTAGMADGTPSVTDRSPPITDNITHVTDWSSRAARNKKKNKSVPADGTPLVTDRDPSVTDRTPTVTDLSSRATRDKTEHESVPETTSTENTSTKSKRPGM